MCYLSGCYHVFLKVTVTLTGPPFPFAVYSLLNTYCILLKCELDHVSCPSNVVLFYPNPIPAALWDTVLFDLLSYLSSFIHPQLPKYFDVTFSYLPRYFCRSLKEELFPSRRHHLSLLSLCSVYDCCAYILFIFYCCFMCLSAIAQCLAHSIFLISLKGNPAEKSEWWHRFKSPVFTTRWSVEV